MTSRKKIILLNALFYIPLIPTVILMLIVATNAKIGHDIEDYMSIDGLDIFSYEKFNNSNYAKDKNFVYFETNKVDQADPNSFTLITGSRYYAKDKNFVYWEGKTINGADTNSFELIHNSAAKDKNFVYMGDFKLENADPKSYIIMDYGYAKDKNFVYYMNEIIDGADSATFNIFGKGTYFARDKNFVYDNGKKQTFDAESFMVLNHQFFKDKNNVYCYGKRMPNADSATFEVYNTYIDYKFIGGSRDKNFIYYGCEPVQRSDQ